MGEWGSGENNTIHCSLFCEVVANTQKSPGAGNLITLWRYVFMGRGRGGGGIFRQGSGHVLSNHVAVNG